MLLRKILEEQTLGLSGVVDEATIAKVGKISGASHLFLEHSAKWAKIFDNTKNC